MSPDEILDVLAQHAITPVIRETDADRAHMAIGALRAAGFRVFEITLTVPGAVELVRHVSEDPDLLVGVGTVFRPEEATAAVAAGARFVVSPAVLPQVATAAARGGAAAILGALTPTEVWAARDAGADAVKIFPIRSVGGPSHVKALNDVFPDVPLIPTGGVGFEDLPAYLSAGAHSVGVGGALTAARDAQALQASARRYLDRARRARTHDGENPS